MVRIAVGLLLVAAIAFSLWRLAEKPVGPRGGIPLAPAGEGVDREAEAASPAMGLPERSESAVSPEPDADVRVEGDLRADATGRFVPGPEALQLFDSFLTARGEESDASVRIRVAAEAERRLPETARAAALALYDQYLAYLVRVAAIARKVSDPTDMQRRHELVRELRREAFGAALAYALFQEREQIEAVAVERRRVMSDPTLSDRQRIQRLAEIQAGLPEEVRRAEAEAYSSLRLAREEDELRAGGGSEAEIQALREKFVGVEAADRLGQLDRERASWAQRMEEYREERDRVMAGTTNAPDEAKAAFMRRVRSRHFTPEELPRVEALDRIEMRDRSLGRAPVTIE